MKRTKWKINIERRMITFDVKDNRSISDQLLLLPDQPGSATAKKVCTCVVYLYKGLYASNPRIQRYTGRLN